ncbi:hypothetical protein ACI789_00415 [Geodermatophilus sp. SYSU D00965]
MLPELKDGGPGFRRTGIRIRVAGRPGAFGGVDEAGGVVGEPAGEGPVGPVAAELGKDSLTEGGDGVSGR